MNTERKFTDLEEGNLAHSSETFRLRPHINKTLPIFGLEADFVPHLENFFLLLFIQERPFKGSFATDPLVDLPDLISPGSRTTVGQRY